MKNRYSTLDIAAAVVELRRHCGMRVNNVYDVDHKTYIVRLQKPDTKVSLLMESGTFIHATTFDWPKQTMPSSFSMKLRKHIRQKRLEAIEQVGVDRVVKLTFGTEGYAVHVILELYDRGNIVLADSDFSILNVLRPRTDKDKDVRFAVRERYPLELAKQATEAVTEEALRAFLEEWKGKPGDQVRRALVPLCTPGPALLEHCMISQGLASNLKMSALLEQTDSILAALRQAQEIFNDVRSKGSGVGVIVCRKDQAQSAHTDTSTDLNTDFQAQYENNLIVYHEFHPMLFAQHKLIEDKGLIKSFESFNAAVDEFISKMESQKIDVKAAAQERTAMKKLEGIRQDHFKRIDALRAAQDTQAQKGALIEMNADLVEKAILVIRSAVAAQISWPEIEEMLSEAQSQGDPVATSIKALKLDTNHISLEMGCPGPDSDDLTQIVDVDLALGAHANARKYYVGKKQAGVKEQKTLQVSGKALKNAEKKTAETLKQVQVKTKISKARKSYWFEKFYWFISTEGYVVIGGRDQQQNEVIVKRYLRPGDVYVHADIRGASSVVVKNRYGPAGGDIPPKTLNEAGMMAVCYSAAWEAKVVASAWWVYHDQVSKTAPSGEYLTTGSFMIRGKKNPLPPAQLIMGFGLLFRLADDEGDDLVEEEDGGNPRESGRAGAGFWPHIQPSDIEDPEKDPPPEEGIESTVSDAATEQFDDIEIADETEDDLPEVQTDKLTKANSEHSQIGSGSETLDDHEGSQNSSKDPDNPLASDSVEDVEDFPDFDVSLKIARSISNTADNQSTANDSLTTENSDTTKNSFNEPPKRGKKGKLKKMKEKYKNQDDEDRELYSQLLKSAGAEKESQKVSKKKGGKGKKAQSKPKVPVERKTKEEFVAAVLGTNEETVPNIAEPKPENLEANEEDVGDDLDAARLDSDLSSAIRFLTPIPAPGDPLLFCLPVCAPYNVLTNYKYKVKLIPGTGKRGSATKTAISLFLKGESGDFDAPMQLERDLIKALDNMDMSRNFPGRVKLSAPQLSAAKKK